MSAKLANIVPVLALCAALLCSCGTREELLESYDSCFLPIPDESASFTLTRDTQGMLIFPEAYTVKKFYDAGERFCLSCPIKCDSYDWYVTPEDNPGYATVSDDVLRKASLKDDENGTYHWISRDISFRLAKSRDCVFFEEALNSTQSLTYTIHLVVEVGGQRFYDSAWLIIRALPDEQKEEFKTDD